MQRWAVLRLIIAAVSLVLSWLLLPTQVEYNRLAHEWQIAASNDPRMRELLGEFDAASNRRLTMITHAGGTIAVATYSAAALGLNSSLQKELDELTYQACNSSGTHPCKVATLWTQLGQIPSVKKLTDFIRDFFHVAPAHYHMNQLGNLVSWVCSHVKSHVMQPRYGMIRKMRNYRIDKIG